MPIAYVYIITKKLHNESSTGQNRALLESGRANEQ